MSAISIPIFQARGRLLVVFFAMLILGAMYIPWSVTTVLAAKRVGGEGSIIIMMVGTGVVVTAMVFKAIWMLLKSGKPVANFTAAGILLRNGQTLVWSDIQGLTLVTVTDALGSGTIKTSLVIDLDKGAKTLTYVKLSREQLTDIIKKTHRQDSSLLKKQVTRSFPERRVE